MDTSFAQTQSLPTWKPTRITHKDDCPLTPIRLEHSIPVTGQAMDLFSKLQKTRLRSIYQKYIKKYVFARRVVQWTWRHGFSIYANLSPWLSKKTRKWLPIVPLSTVVNKFSKSRHCFVNESIVKTTFQSVFPSKEQHLLGAQNGQYLFPEIGLNAIQNGLVYGGTNLIFTESEILCHDLYDFEHDYTSEELHARVVINSKKKCIRWLVHDDKPEVIKKAAVFVDACASNYAHWLTEVLPRINLFCSDSRFKGIPIIVNAGLHANLRDSLFLICGDREVIYLPIGRALSVEHLYVTSPTGYIPFEVRPRKFKRQLSHGLFSPDALKMLCDGINRSLQADNSADFPKKIYLRRGPTVRKLINESEVEKRLIARGFAIIAPETLSFAEQVTLFQNAEIIIGPTGAACANIIFSNPEVNVAILMGIHKNMPYRYWSNMANAAGVKKINYILGSIVQNKAYDFHGNYQIDINDLLSYLDNLENQ